MSPMGEVSEVEPTVAAQSAGQGGPEGGRQEARCWAARDQGQPGPGAQMRPRCGARSHDLEGPRAAASQSPAGAL